MNSSHTTKEIKEKIVECLNEMGITVKNIILFGSRARGDFQEESDWDFLIITKKTYSVKEKMEIAKKIRTTLAELRVPVDIIINSDEEVQQKKNLIGCATRYAIKEGIEI